MDAIVLDGEHRAALAVTRSLGRKGIRVAVGAEKIPSLASCSRYCSESFSYPSPYTEPAGFLQALRETLDRSGRTVLLPMTDVTLTEVLSNKGMLPKSASLPFADYDRYLQVSDKTRLYRLGRELGVPTPATLLSDDFEDREALVASVREAGFPVVVKPGYSRIRTDRGWIDAGVRYAKTERELREILSSPVFRQFPFLIQQRVEGPGIGVFLLMKNGEVITRFAHRRIREKPPSGGVSVLCESIEIPEGAAREATRILEWFRWTGVAMVEFKIDREDKVAKLLEINARFWGSLQLAINSGVDFPYLLYRMANGEPIDIPDRYAVGMKSRWEFGDLDHLLMRLFKIQSKLNLPSSCPTRISLVGDFLLDCFRPSVKIEVFRIHDRRPFFHELGEYVRHFVPAKNAG